MQLPVYILVQISRVSFCQKSFHQPAVSTIIWKRATGDQSKCNDLEICFTQHDALLWKQEKAHIWKQEKGHITG